MSRGWGWQGIKKGSYIMWSPLLRFYKKIIWKHYLSQHWVCRGNCTGRTRLQFPKINMSHHILKPSCEEMMNSLSINRNQNSPSPKMSILQKHMQRPVKCIDQYKISNVYWLILKICPHICFRPKIEDNFEFEINVILVKATHC